MSFPPKITNFCTSGPDTSKDRPWFICIMHNQKQQSVHKEQIEIKDGLVRVGVFSTFLMIYFFLAYLCKQTWRCLRGSYTTAATPVFVMTCLSCLSEPGCGFDKSHPFTRQLCCHYCFCSLILTTFYSQETIGIIYI